MIPILSSKSGSDFPTLLTRPTQTLVVKNLGFRVGLAFCQYYALHRDITAIGKRLDQQNERFTNRARRFNALQEHINESQPMPPLLEDKDPRAKKTRSEGRWQRSPWLCSRLLVLEQYIQGHGMVVIEWLRSMDYD